jgi:hypothetical protein
MPPLLRPGTSPSVNNKCLLDLDRCFGSFWSRAENTTSADMFTRLTFQYPDCGDCSESLVKVDMWLMHSDHGPCDSVRPSGVVCLSSSKRNDRHQSSSGWTAAEIPTPSSPAFDSYLARSRFLTAQRVVNHVFARGAS